MSDLISRQAAIDALWKALYEYEDEMEKRFQESDELDVGDWMLHRIFVQNMSDIDKQTILNLPSAQPELSTDVENALALLDGIRASGRMEYYSDYCALHDAISSISAELEQENYSKERYKDLCDYFSKCSDHGDVILHDRKEFKAWLDRMHWHVMECDKLARQLEKAAQPKRKNAKWRTVIPVGYKEEYRCSECNELVYSKTNYCPCCGSYIGAYTRGGCHGNK